MTERVVPRGTGEWDSRESYLMYLRHLAAYHFAQPMAKDRRVLDLGSGVGYGTSILVDGAKEVIALDIAPDALLATKPTAIVTGSVAGDGAWLPLRDETFDLIVSFQVIEHIWDETRYLSEVRRVLTPGGLFIVSTPNKALRLLPFQPPFNPYHVREYDYRSLKEVLRGRFVEANVQGLHGTPEIMARERERLKQNPLKVYLELVAQKTLPSPALQGLQSLIKILRSWGGRITLNAEANCATSPSFSEDMYSVNDFWIDANRVEMSLDLIGICRKS